MTRTAAPNRRFSMRIRKGLLAGGGVLSLAAPGAAQDAEPIDLGAIVVTAGGFEQSVKDAPASVTVISSEELEKGAFSNLTDALRDVQGVAVTGVANERDIMIRGLPGQYTLILVDGRRQGTRESRPNGDAGVEQDLIPPISAIERIEIVRGPMSALYGSDAMGGVINIITKKAGREWTGSVTASGTLQQHSKYGNSGQVAFNLSGPLIEDRLGVQVWGRFLDRDEDEFLDGSQGQREYDLTSRLSFTPVEDHELWLEFGRTRLRDETSDGKVLAVGAGDRETRHERDHIALGYTGYFGAAIADLSIQHEIGKRRVTDITPDGVATRSPRVPKIENTVVDGKLTLPFDFGGEHTVVTGFQYNSARLSDEDFDGRKQKMKADQWALFVEDEWRIVEDFALTGGLRYDHHDAYGDHVTPRLYGVWHVTNELTAKGGVSTGFRAPALRQVASDYYYGTQRGAGVIPGNPDLKPEKSTSYEFGLLWDNNDDLSFGATAFHTDFRDKLSNANTNRIIDTATGAITDPGMDCSAEIIGGTERCLWESFNIGKAKVQGIELTAAWRPVETLGLRANYTYTDSKQKNGPYQGYPLARTPAHRAGLRADWMTPVEGLDLWASLNYHGSEKNGGARIGTSGTPIMINGVEGRKYKAYATVDLGGSYAVNETVQVNAAIYNLFDEKRDVDEVNNVLEERRFWLGVTARF